MLNRLFASRKRPFIPNRDQRDTVEIDLSGTKLRLTLPPHSDYEGFKKDEAPSHINIYDDTDYIGDEHLPSRQREGISHQLICERSWEFYGPAWRSRPYGSVDLRIVLCQHDLMPESMSCFNEEHFEQIAIRSAYYNGPARPNSQKTITPQNWSLNLSDGNTWIYFEKWPDLNSQNNSESEEHTYRNHELRIPIDDRLFLILNFRYLGYAPASQCLHNMDSLKDSILKSIECVLSDSAKQSLKSARQKWPNAQASKSRSPEVWTYPETREGKIHLGEDRLIIINPGSPPPAFSP
jgi:hypothetical protein